MSIGSDYFIGQLCGWLVVILLGSQVRGTVMCVFISICTGGNYYYYYCQVVVF